MRDDTGAIERYILCRPRNGLNDAFVDIAKCWQYAEAFDRILLIDPIRCAIFTNLALFFSPLPPSSRVILNVFPNQIEWLNSMSCRPIEMRGRLHTYSITLIRSGNSNIICDSESKAPLRVDMTRDYPEQLVLHEAGNGGSEGIEFLKRVAVEANLARDMIAKIRLLGPNYAAVHVRHSDYRTNWRKFLKSIRKDLIGRTVLICSDNAKVVRAAPLILKKSVVQTVSKVQYNDGRPQHLRASMSDESRNETARSALTDLFALGAASDLYITDHARGRTSGYSLLATSICSDRTILNSLLGENLYSKDDAQGKVHHVRLSKSVIFGLVLSLEDRVRSLKKFIKVFLRVRNH